jgi:hypothetical protein
MESQVIATAHLGVDCGAGFESSAVWLPLADDQRWISPPLSREATKGKLPGNVTIDVTFAR